MVPDSVSDSLGDVGETPDTSAGVSPTSETAPASIVAPSALAVRGALMADGVASAHIYVRALGSQTDTEPADRVDIGVMGGNATETAR